VNQMAMNARLLRPLASGGFNPSRLQNLALWLDSADQSTVTTATGISAVTDKSGNGRTFSQAVANNQPSYTNTQNGRKVATFDGSNDSLSGPNIISALPATVLQVVFFPSFKTVGMTFEQLTAVNVDHLAVYRGFGGSDTRFRLFNGVDLTSVSTMPESTWAVYGGVFGDTSATSNALKNGVVDAAGDAGTTTPSGTVSHLAFFNGGVGAAKFTPVRIAETVAYSRALLFAEIQQLSQHFAQKWGFTL
jgi:hypothetical protein